MCISNEWSRALLVEAVTEALARIEQPQIGNDGVLSLDSAAKRMRHASIYCAAPYAAGTIPARQSVHGKLSILQFNAQDVKIYMQLTGAGPISNSMTSNNTTDEGRSP